VNIVNGYQKKKDYESRERWVIARKMMHASLTPYLKDEMSEIEFMQFPWEEDLAKKLEEQYDESYLQKIQESIQMWERIDSQRNISCGLIKD